MTRVDAIREKYRLMREDPMTPQYLTGQGQSGSLLDYQESEELGEAYCLRDGHRPLVTDQNFCTCCGHRFCTICDLDLGRVYATFAKHMERHA